MKPPVLIFSFFASLYAFAQEQVNLEESKLENYVLQCDNIAKSLMDKETKTNVIDWYEGAGKEIAEFAIQQLESDIDKSSQEISHYLMVLSIDPLIFSLHFYYDETEAEFGHMFIFFKDKNNNLVDDLQFVSKAYYEMSELELLGLKGAPNALIDSED